MGEESRPDDSNNGSQTEDLELPLFGLSTIAIATNNFSIHNRLGKGGFGPVYKVTTSINILLKSSITIPDNLKLDFVDLLSGVVKQKINMSSF